MPLAYLPSPGRSIWHFGPVPVRAQSICVLAGILLAVWLARRRYASSGGDPAVLLDVAAWAVPAALIPSLAGVLLARHDSGFWHAARAMDAAAGFPGAAGFGLAGAWLGCRRMRGPRGARIKLGPVAGAVAPGIAFALAIGSLGDWLRQQGYGHPSSLWWAVEISPVHRLAGFENYATFQPVFAYQALWDVAAGFAVIMAARRFALSGDRTFAVFVALYAIGGIGLGWMRMGQLPVVLGIRAGQLGDIVVGVLAIGYLIRTHRKHSPVPNPVRALETDPSGM